MNLPAIFGIIGLFIAYTLINAKQVIAWVKAANNSLIEYPPAYIMACLGLLSAVCLMFWWIGGGKW